MSDNSRTNNAGKFIRNAGSRYARLNSLSSTRKFIKRNAGTVAGVFSLLTAILVVWAWSVIASPNRNRADITNSPDVANSSSIFSSTSNQSGVAGGPNISIDKNGSGPATVTVNGQPVPVPANGSLHKEINNPDGSKTSVDVNASNGSASNSNTTTTTVNSNSNSFVSSNSFINSFSYSSGGTTISN